MTGIAALPLIHAALEGVIVTLMMSVPEIWFVEQTTVLMGILQIYNIQWIAVPPLPAP